MKNFFLVFITFIFLNPLIGYTRDLPTVQDMEGYSVEEFMNLLAPSNFLAESGGEFPIEINWELTEIPIEINWVLTENGKELLDRLGQVSENANTLKSALEILAVQSQQNTGFLGSAPNQIVMYPRQEVIWRVLGSNPNLHDFELFEKMAKHATGSLQFSYARNTIRDRFGSEVPNREFFDFLDTLATIAEVFPESESEAQLLDKAFRKLLSLFYENGQATVVLLPDNLERIQNIFKQLGLSESRINLIMDYIDGNRYINPFSRPLLNEDMTIYNHMGLLYMNYVELIRQAQADPFTVEELQSAQTELQSAQTVIIFSQIRVALGLSIVDFNLTIPYIRRAFHFIAKNAIRPRGEGAGLIANKVGLFKPFVLDHIINMIAHKVRYISFPSLFTVEEQKQMTLAPGSAESVSELEIARFQERLKVEDPNAIQIQEAQILFWELANNKKIHPRSRLKIYQTAVKFLGLRIPVGKQIRFAFSRFCPFLLTASGS